MFSKLMTESYCNRGRVCIKENTVYLLCPGESGNDFCAVCNPVV